MQFLVDESTGIAVVNSLRDLGHDVLAAAEEMLQADDASILTRAETEGRILITNDKDFGELVYREGSPHQGIVLLRLEDESANNRVRVIRALLEKHSDRLAGSFTVVTERNVRIRPSIEP